MTLTQIKQQELAMRSKEATTRMIFDEALHVQTNVSLSDRISVPSKRTMTDAGQMHVPCKFARTGTQLYTAGQLGLADVDPKKVMTVYRDEADVFDAASIESFRSSPLTIGHPMLDGVQVPVSAANSKELQVGMLEGMPVRDEDTLGGNLVLTAQAAIDALADGTQELSAGYTCDIEMLDGKLYQRNIRANHIAIVAKGRAGSSCRISDEAEVHLADELLSVQTELADSKAELVEAQTKLDTQTILVDELNTSISESEVSLAKARAELTDAILAATEGVIERCEVIESARLIADMRDLGSKSTLEIKRMVIEDQMPDKDLKEKSSAYIDAMFEILVDHSKGETPMGKLMKTQESHVMTDVKPIDPVAVARQKMIKRNSER
jgi:hypothetical protein